MNQRTFNSALLLGITAGLRTMTAPAALALAQQQKFTTGPWLLDSPKVARALTMLAVGEMIFDKLPFAPNRIAPGGLVGRLLSGGMCGAVVAHEEQREGALLGMIGALAGSSAGFFLRRGAVRASGLPDAVVAVAEDALAIGVAAVAVNADRYGRRRIMEMHSAHVA